VALKKAALDNLRAARLNILIPDPSEQESREEAILGTISGLTILERCGAGDLSKWYLSEPVDTFPAVATG
jgi:hypothetical protein